MSVATLGGVISKAVRCASSSTNGGIVWSPRRMEAVQLLSMMKQEGMQYGIVNWPYGVYEGSYGKKAWSYGGQSWP